MKGKEEMTLNISERENYLMFLASVAVRPSKDKKENRKSDQQRMHISNF